MSSLAGKLLLDSGRLAGSYFDRSVVLMCRHDEEGALGLVLSRPTRHTVGDVLKELPHASFTKIPLFLGGPVQPELLNFIFLNEKFSDLEILNGLCWGRSFEDVRVALGQEFQVNKIVAFAGYAGWSAGQLENELKAGCWMSQEADPALIFGKNTDRLWNRILHQKGGIHRLMADAPDRPSLN